MQSLARLVPLALLIGCGEPTVIADDAGAFPDSGLRADAGAPFAPDEQPLSVIRVVPSHGTFSGGNRAVIRGSGFASSAVTVRFGDTAVPATDVRRVGSGRLEVTVPAGAPGTVDVSVEQDDVLATLSDGYRYDAVELRPNSGPPSGGTPVRLTAATAAFDASTEVRFDGEPCTSPTVVSPTELTCRTPAHDEGYVDVRIEMGSSTLDLEDGYRYVEPFGPDPGLSGGPLEGTLEVLVRGGFGIANQLLEGALVMAGPVGATQRFETTDADGRATLRGDDLRGPIQVAAFHPCAGFMGGYVGFDASHVTIHLPFSFLDCVEGGGTAGSRPGAPTGDVSGEMVFLEGQEFPVPVFEWIGVPDPGPGQERAAYVALIRTPPVSDPFLANTVAIQRVTEADRGERGYRYSFENVPAGEAYAVVGIAGIENIGGGSSDPPPDRGGSDEPGPPRRQPGPSFEPAVVGLGAPVAPVPRRPRTRVDVEMDAPLGGGRTITASAPSDLPPLYRIDDSQQVVATTLDTMTAEVRYSVPERASRLGLLFGDSDPWSMVTLSGPIGSLDLGRQPNPAGSFADAEHAVLIRISGGASSTWNPGPYTSTVVRTPIGTDDIAAGDLLPIVRFNEPSTPNAPEPADRTIRWELPSDTRALQLISINSLNFGEVPAPGFQFIASTSARGVTLPDFTDVAGRGATGSGAYSVMVTALEAQTAVDRIEGAVAVTGRSSQNLTSINWVGL